MSTPHCLGLWFIASVLALSLSACRKRAGDEHASAHASASAASSVSAGKSPEAAPVVAPAEAEPDASAQAEPAPESPVPEIPEGRSKPPSVSEWQAARELNTQEPNSQAENCQMKVVREWLKVYCHGEIRGFSDMVEFGEKTRDYFLSLRKGKSVDFVVRLRRGKTMKIKVQRKDAREAVLYVSWPQDKARPVHIALGRGKPPEKEPPAKEEAAKDGGKTKK